MHSYIWAALLRFYSRWARVIFMCTVLDGFSLFVSLPRTTWRPAHSVHMSVCNLNKSCVFFVVRFPLPFSQRSKGYFVLDLPLVSSNLFSLVTSGSPVGRMNTLSIPTTPPPPVLKHLFFFHFNDILRLENVREVV